MAQEISTRLRLPRSLHVRLRRQAESDGVSLHSHMVRLLGEASAVREATMTTAAQIAARYDNDGSYWTTWGPVRACCGHMHRTAGAAHRCATRDDARAKLQGRDCYSDRRVRRVSSREELRGYDVTQGPGEPLATMDEEAQP